jgi:hypothetical protein
MDPNGIDGTQLDDWIQFGSTLGLDWFASIQGRPLPSQSALERTIGVDFGTVSPQMGLSMRGITGGQVLFAAVVVVGLIWILRK